MIDQLAKLNKLAPDICRVNLAPTPIQYFIGDYGFWINPENELIACPMGLLVKNIGGRFALAWLRDALEGEIERRGWDYEHRFFDRIGTTPPRHKIIFINGKGPGHIANTPIDALLAAFLAAVEGEGR